MTYTDQDINGKVTLGERFFAYKQKSVGLRETLERHFNQIMKDIKGGFKDVHDDRVDEEEDFTFKDDGKGEWSCMQC